MKSSKLPNARVFLLAFLALALSTCATLRVLRKPPPKALESFVEVELSP